MNSVINWAFFSGALGFFNKSSLDHLYTIIRSLITRRIKAEGQKLPIINESSQAIVISTDDARLVMEELGMLLCSEACPEKCLAEAHVLLEEKEASLAELEEAFAVFDENGDGFISADELRVVLQKLKLNGREDCERMIRAYDKDGDGKISFEEFKNLLEGTA